MGEGLEVVGSHPHLQDELSHDNLSCVVLIAHRCHPLDKESDGCEEGDQVGVRTGYRHVGDLISGANPLPQGMEQHVPAKSRVSCAFVYTECRQLYSAPIGATTLPYDGARYVLVE